MRGSVNTDQCVDSIERDRNGPTHFAVVNGPRDLCVIVDGGPDGACDVGWLEIEARSMVATETAGGKMASIGVDIEIGEDSFDHYCGFEV